MRDVSGPGLEVVHITSELSIGKWKGCLASAGCSLRVGTMRLVLGLPKTSHITATFRNQWPLLK